MRKEKLHLAAKVKDIRNGKYFTVTGPDTIAEIDRDDNIIEDGEVVTITEENCRCFTTVKWAPETDPEGYSVDDGQLVKNGQPATEQGEIRVTNIIGTIPGCLVLEVKKGNEDLIMTYRPVTNKFTKISQIDDTAMCDIYMLEKLEDSLIIGLNQYRVEQVADKEDPEKVTETYPLDYAAVLRVYQKYADSDVTSTGPIEADMVTLVGDNLYVGTCKDRDLNDIPVQYDRFNIFEMERVEDAIQTGSQAQFGQSEKGTVIISADRIITRRAEIKTREAAKLTGFKYIIDEYEDEDNTYRLFLADDDRNVREISRKRTDDRGDIVTVA